MIANIFNEEVFGEVKAHVCVIEFQKSALPDANYIFYLSKSSKATLLQPNIVISIILSYIPSSDN